MRNLSWNLSAIVQFLIDHSSHRNTFINCTFSNTCILVVYSVCIGWHWDEETNNRTNNFMLSIVSMWRKMILTSKWMNHMEIRQINNLSTQFWIKSFLIKLIKSYNIRARQINPIVNCTISHSKECPPPPKKKLDLTGIHKNLKYRATNNSFDFTVIHSTVACHVKLSRFILHHLFSTTYLVD